MHKRRKLIGLLRAVLMLALAAGAGSPGAGAADFDRDGYADLAVGVPRENVGAVESAGVVHALYGSSTGLTATGDQLWDQDDLITSEGIEPWDLFGIALAAGDFDGNGAADLAIGVSEEDFGTYTEAGAVHVLYGGLPSGGLSARTSQLWHQNSPGVAGFVGTNEFFGAALAAGDFDGDGYGDLAVGVPRENVDTAEDAGAVNVLYGTQQGLTASGSQLWHQGDAGLGDSAEPWDQFGATLATGDFDGDGRDDLAIGIPSEDDDFHHNSGLVTILYGTSSGLSAVDSQTWMQGLDGIGNAAEENDRFGSSLVAGDFNGDTYADLAVGVSGEDWGTIEAVGAVTVLYGSPDGLAATGNQVWFDANYEADDVFGSALAAGDFNGDTYEDLAVGIRGEDINSIANAGAVQILYGASSGLYRRGGIWNDFWYQDRGDMADQIELNDQFGSALAAGDFNHDSYVDLAVGIKLEDIGSIQDAGAVQILYGSANGISATGNQFWHQDSPYVEESAELQDEFGYALAAIPREMDWVPRIYLPQVMRNHQP
ncbi:MAG: FG-GAP repeat protein [Anaerolineae bacterium]|jgi:hypothetical protein